MSLSKLTLVIVAVIALVALIFWGVGHDSTEAPAPSEPVSETSSETEPGPTSEDADAAPAPATASTDAPVAPEGSEGWICTQRDAEANCLQWTANRTGAAPQ